MDVRPVRDKDVDSLAATLARAFHDDPVTRWMYPADHRRAVYSGRFFRWQLERLDVFLLDPADGHAAPGL